MFPDGSFKVLDRGEYKYHKKLMHYSKEIDYILKKELDLLIVKARENAFPFKKEYIYESYNKYKNYRNIGLKL